MQKSPTQGFWEHGCEPANLNSRQLESQVIFLIPWRDSCAIKIFSPIFTLSGLARSAGISIGHPAISGSYPYYVINAGQNKIQVEQALGPVPMAQHAHFSGSQVHKTPCHILIINVLKFIK
jgi:hypothetical protein